MTSLFDKPVYSIILYPNDNFFYNLNLFFKENNIDKKELDIPLNFHHQVKASFYLSDVYTEEKMIESFKNINSNDLQYLFNQKFIFNSVKKINENLFIIFNEDRKFNFLKNQTMRNFDLYRKTLDANEIKKDLLRFRDLSEKEFFYYQIWGYPYYFEYDFHGIPITIFKEDMDLKDHFNTLQYSSLKLLKKQTIYNSNYDEIVSLE